MSNTEKSDDPKSPMAALMTILAEMPYLEQAGVKSLVRDVVLNEVQKALAYESVYLRMLEDYAFHEAKRKLATKPIKTQ